MQKHFNTLIAAFFLYCSCALGGISSFVRINEATRNVELAFNTYLNPKTGQLVRLIAVFHIGDKAFYNAVRDKMKNTTVLYESLGLTLEDVKRANTRINELGGSIATIFSSPELTGLLLAPDWSYTYALALGLAHQQEALKYDAAAELIHADKLSTEIQQNSEKILEKNKQNEELLREALNKKIGYLGMTFPSICKKTAEYALYCVNMATWLNNSKEKFLRTLIKDILERKTFTPDFYERNQIVTDKLDPLIDTPKTSNIITIIYGANHAPFFEKYLVKNGFALIKTKWVVLTSLDQN